MKREKIEIIADILSLLEKEDKRKTQIMYRANLSYEVFNKYLAMILNAGLVEAYGSFYKITEKGEDFLERCKNYLRKRKRVEKSVEEVNRIRKELEELVLA